MRFARKLLLLALAAGVILGYGSAIGAAVHHGGAGWHCHEHDDDRDHDPDEAK